eukprot:CAMPEP_0197436240 /NCGR_PEP_ID=MMETSP1175-20131217/3712_1 /TAXON_ID=1003142 /ORGANISM="Triceratium dubium, Strain CCMP147" /LENGTH=276 /DNA_ID=CAMNT_0042965479 /DNA_START=127 /DNA_END=957 /DNA_ORIENTATION=+
MMRRTFAAVLAISSLSASAAEQNARLRGQDGAHPQNDFEVDDSVLMARGVKGLSDVIDPEVVKSVKRSDHWTRRMKNEKSKGNDKMYKVTLERTPIDGFSRMQIQGGCIRWNQKPNAFTALVPPGLENKVAKQMPQKFHSKKTEELASFNFKNICSATDRKDKCKDKSEAVTALGTAAISEAKSCGHMSLPCAKFINPDDVSVSIKKTPQPYTGTINDWRVKSITFEGCSAFIDFVSESMAPPAMSTVTVAALISEDTADVLHDTKTRGKEDKKKG